MDFDFTPGAGAPDSPPGSGDTGVIPPYVEALNPRQREAVLHTEGPLIVLAGAGSGKTKMLTSRIAYLIQGKRVPGHQILAVTFTNKAAAEMRDRVEKALNLSAGQLSRSYGSYMGIPEIGTFHSVCVRLLRRELLKTPFTQAFVIYDDSDQLSLIKGVFKKLDLDDKAVNPKSIQGAINRLKCDAVEPKDLEPSPHNLFERHLKRVYEQYQKDLFANNALDFGEIICMTYRLLRDDAEVRAKYQKRFRYVHVDEYQDTNRSQYLLLAQLAGANTGGHQNICVVGDEDQSIYKWRGADIRNILDFESDYPGGHTVKLEQNYRSTKTIIRAAGEVIKNNKQRKDKTLWTENEDGVQIVRTQLPDERAEAEQVVSEIRRLAEHESRAYGDFALFYRTNAQSRQFEDVLRREKIPYQIVGGLRFYDRKEIKDVLSYFKVILNPSDSIGLKRIINVPARGIGKTTIDKVDDYYVRESLANPAFTYWDALRAAASNPSLTSAGTAKKLGGFVALVQRLVEERPKLLVSELYHLILDETGYVRELRAEATEESLARIENLEEFDNLLQEFEQDNYESLPDTVTVEEKAAVKGVLLERFIEQSSLVADADSLDGYASSVKMMTLHSSKGLEFPVVFMVGMEEGLFPSIRNWEETPDADVEEERRLCYVGMTRAREQLYLSNVIVRRFWGNVNYQEPSRFFLEIPGEYMNFRDLARSYGSSLGGAYRGGGGGTAAIAHDDGAGSMSTRPSSSSAAFGGKSDVVGQRILHPDYGPGTVIAADGAGSEQKVTIEFRGRQQKKFLLRYVVSYLED